MGEGAFKVLSEKKGKEVEITGTDYYLKMTPTSAPDRYKVFDGARTFLVFGLKKTDFDYFVKLGKLPSGFVGDIYEVVGDKTKPFKFASGESKTVAFNEALRTDFVAALGNNSFRRKLNIEVTGKDYYFKVTAGDDSTSYRIFDGKRTFTVTDFTPVQLTELLQTGRANVGDSDLQFIYLEKGYSQMASAEQFNQFVQDDFKAKLLESAKFRKTIDTAGMVPSKLTFKPPKPGTLVESALSSFMELDTVTGGELEGIVRKGVRNKKNFTMDSDKFKELYAPELVAIDKALDAYEKDGDKMPLLKVLAALINKLPTVNATRESNDLLFYILYEMEQRNFDIRLSSVEGLSAKIQVGSKWKDKKLESADDILNASKTKEGRTWLVGLLQEYEVTKLQERKAAGFDVEREQAQVLDYCQRYQYGPGQYTKYQKAYQKAKLTGNLEGFEGIMNPVDYISVAKKTGGRGGLAAGPSTIASFMLVAAVTKPEEPVEIPVPKYTEPQDMVLEGAEDMRIVGMQIVLNAAAKVEGKTLPSDFLENSKPEFTFSLVEYVPSKVKSSLFGIPLSSTPERFFLIVPEDAPLTKDGPDGYDATNISNRLAFVKPTGEEGVFDIFIYLKGGKLVDPSNPSDGNLGDGVTELKIGEAVRSGKTNLDVTLDPKYVAQYNDLLFGKIDVKKDAEQNDDGSISLTIRGRGAVNEEASYSADVSVRYIRQKKVE